MSRRTTIADYREGARGNLPRFLFDYIDGAAQSEATLNANTEDLSALRIRQRVLRDVSAIDTATSLFGRPVAQPLALSPIGMAGLYARRGEAQGARAAAAANIPFTLSTMSICDLDEVQAASGAKAWFQLYITRDRGFMADAIARATERGAEALVLTVDMPVAGLRYRDRRTGLSGPPSLMRELRTWSQIAMRPGWAVDVGLLGRPHVFGTVAASAEGDFGVNAFWAWVAGNFDPTVTLKDVEAVRALWKGPLVIKGVLDAGDARDVVAAGADGLVVSNHGGRQLDGAASSIAALPRIRDAVGDGVTVLMDGGVRSGNDIFRAVASGADAAMIGRPWVFALAAEGQAGVSRMLATMKTELATTMALAGVSRIDQIDRGLLED